MEEEIKIEAEKVEEAEMAESPAEEKEAVSE